MEKGKKMSITLAVIIFLVVVAVLLFITINKKKDVPVNSLASKEVSDIVQNLNTQNMQQENTNQDNNTGATGEVAKNGDTVAMNYTGKLLNGTVFDSNVDPKFQHVEPFVFTIGAGQVIKGWDKGIAGMKVGEKKTLTIPSEDGYGATGAAGGRIPPNATLVFDVELLAIKK